MREVATRAREARPRARATAAVRRTLVPRERTPQITSTLRWVQADARRTPLQRGQVTLLKCTVMTCVPLFLPRARRRTVALAAPGRRARASTFTSAGESTVHRWHRSFIHIYIYNFTFYIYTFVLLAPLHKLKGSLSLSLSLSSFIIIQFLLSTFLCSLGTAASRLMAHGK